MTPTDIPAIQNRIRTQDNYCTRDPFYVVERRRRIYGLDPVYGGPVVWVDRHDNWCEVTDPEEIKALEDAAEDGQIPEGYEETAYVDTWEFVTACFTERAAQDFIAANRHRHSEPLQMFVDTLYRNHEMLAVREHLMKDNS